MKIAIMTWFHFRNYGTALQVTALTKKLESYGHEVRVIQYYPTPRASTILTDSFITEIWKKIVSKIKNRNKYHVIGDKVENKFETFLQQQISLTEVCDSLPELELLNKEFDAFICGSDQIWTPLGFDRHYFLDFVKDPRRMIAYAPSIGVSDIKNKYVEDKMRELTKRFTYLSTRENAGAEILEELLGEKVTTVLDPTLLIDGDKWLEIVEENEVSEQPYLLAYFLGSNEKYWKVVYKLAERLGLEVKIIPLFPADFHREGSLGDEIGPKEFVSYIANASYICTDSFHGVAFSINFKKNFCCFERFKANAGDSQNSRIYNILDLADLRERLYSKEADLNKFVLEINYEKVIEKMRGERDESEEFLLGALVQIENSKQSEEKKNHIYKQSSLCCGCGACAQVCPVSAISIQMNDKGFYEAVVNEGKCVSCGKCRQVCPMQTVAFRKKLDKGILFSYKDADGNVLKKSSSGGIAFRLASCLLEQGYSIAGCVFDREKQLARHVLVSPEASGELSTLQGSKYMQSDFFSLTNELCNCKTPIAIFGTPCQIAGIRNLLTGRNDVVYIDLICHGVPSYLVYEKYRKLLSDRYGMNTEGMETVFRYKPKGWRERYIYVENNGKELIRHKNEDEYFLMFESGFCYSEACYECRWRSSCSADLRIGDYWGSRFAEDKTGVSMILSMTEKGNELLELAGVKELIISQPIEDYFKSQQTKNQKKPLFYEEVFVKLKDKSVTLEDVVSTYVMPIEKRREIYMRIRKAYGWIRKKK